MTTSNSIWGHWAEVKPAKLHWRAECTCGWGAPAYTGTIANRLSNRHMDIITEGRKKDEEVNQSLRSRVRLEANPAWRSPERVAPCPCGDMMYDGHCRNCERSKT